MCLSRLSLVALLATSILVVPALALEIGDDAPPLKVEKWVKGGPIDFKDGKGKNIYVVEFWATWCSPCRQSIPHMTQLQKDLKEKGVVVVGVSIDSNDKRNTRKDVGPFVENMGDKMEYTVALDTTERDTSNAYMDAFKYNSIPTAFIVDKAGKIAWVGQAEDTPDHKPSWGNLERALQQISDGKYDLKAAQKADKEHRELVERKAKTRELLEKYFELVANDEKPEGAAKLGQEALAAIGDKDASELNGFAWEILTNPQLKFRDLKLALQAAKAAYDACKGEDAGVVDTYARALWETGSKKEAIEFQKKAVKLAGDDEASRKELEATLAKYESEAK